MQTENHYTETDLGNVSPNPRGNYDNAVKYEYLDLVTMQGGSYLCVIPVGQTITGTAPEPGKNTEHWQCLTMPGDMTPQYTEAHDKVVRLAKEVAQNAAKVAEDKQSVAQMETDVRQLKEQTAESARQAENSKDSAVGSARAAKTAEDNIRQVANNVNTLVNGFDTHVAEKTTEATQAVATAKDNAVQAVERQETASVQEVKDQTTTYIAEQKNLAKQELDDKVNQFGIDVNAIKAEVSEEGQKQITNVQGATTAELAKITEKGTEQAGIVTTEGEKQVQAVQTAAQEIIADREQINTNKEGVAKLKEDVADINSNLYVSKSYSGNPISVYISDKTNIKVNLKDSKKAKVDVYHSKKNLINPLKFWSDKDENIITFENEQIHVQSPLGYACLLKIDIYLPKGDYVISKGAETNCNGVSVYRKGVFFANGALGKGASSGKFKVLESDVYAIQTYTIPNGTTIIDKLQLEVGKLQTPYESYTGEVKSVELADKKGTLSTNSYIGDNIIYSDAETMDVSYLSKELLLETNLLKNKTIIMNGDSICEDIYGNRVGWVGRIGKRNGMTWKNYGISGGTITEDVQDSSGNTKHSVCGTIDVMFKECPDADYIIIEGGTNDADLLGNIIGEEAPRIGSFNCTDYNGTYDTHTFCGAFETICFKLSKYWKHAKVGYIVAPKMGVSTTNGFAPEKNNRRAYFEKAIQICNKWGIPVLNLWDGTPLNPNLDCYYTQGESKEQNETKGNYYIDGQHLTSHGYDWTSGVIENWIKNL